MLQCKIYLYFYTRIMMLTFYPKLLQRTVHKDNEWPRILGELCLGAMYPSFPLCEMCFSSTMIYLKISEIIDPAIFPLN